MAALRAAMARYSPLEASTWEAFTRACRPLELRKGELFVAAGERPRSFAYLHSGLMRAYALDQDGKDYTKLFFDEGMMPGAIVALLEGRPAQISVQALEDCLLIEIDHAPYRRLLESHPDLLMYHCRYLELNWVVAKEPREVALAQQTAGERYEAFQAEHPELERRLSLAQIASHLGVTPTQLSRIRRARKEAAFPRHVQRSPLGPPARMRV